MCETITDTRRWTLGGYARQYSWAQCRYCGRAQNHDCQRVECLLCGTAQCHGNGSGNGCCAVCHHGWLPGWSRMHLPRHYTDDGRTIMACGYAGCEGEAIATARKRSVCRTHAARVKVHKGLTLLEYVAEQIAARDAGQGWQKWRLVA